MIEMVPLRLGLRCAQNGTNAPRPDNGPSVKIHATTTEETGEMDAMTMLNCVVETAGRQMMGLALVGSVLAVLLLTAACMAAGIVNRAR
jgi:hypothetical protein